MNLAEIEAELEDDRTWRLDEIRFLRNQLENFDDEDDRDMYRRSLVVMLYAHFEGFCKFALLQYVRAVRNCGLPCGDAHSSVLAASWHDVFADLAITNVRRVLRAELPADAALATLSRRREFADRVRELLELPISISDKVVDTESNLSTVVLKKNLYRVGLDIAIAEQWSSSIEQLLGRRNNISHGQDRAGVKEPQYRQVQEAALSVMDGVMQLVMGALRQGSFRKTTAA